MAAGVLVVLGPLGVSGVVTAVVRLRRDLRLLDRGTRVPGEVVDLRRATLGHGPVTYAPVVRFRTTDGRELTATPGRWRQTPLDGAPGPVTVIYDPARPSRILMEPATGGGTTSVVVPFVTFLVASVIVLVTGIVVSQRLA
ncbi:DUF3592 domain-containing protein [Micromonospora eburnea]|uniref:DUF3592 domain-containing protein n=1 Tax=Micromonospora eburnea TaxID=227316 RepID=A0A1C6VH58_9ACTN|nr:DUF3592 domain-containing protein [Micromonospora eburnea]SCL65404.1 Protein of unknown function [Micromonospora eburnea]